MKHAAKITSVCTLLLAFTAASFAGEKQGRTLPDLPVGVTSLGAAVAGDALYVYGGHKGTAHEYFKEDQSNDFLRLKLKPGSKWEKLPSGPKLQGLALVAHDGLVYRIGGFTAMNTEDEEQDLVSQADVARFNPQTNKWEDLPSLPQPRSSHDAVVMGDKIYVAGGWQLRGKGAEPKWHDTALVLDLSQEKLAWIKLPKPGFQRRALSVGEADGKVYVVGGIQPQGGVTTKVAAYDPETKNWSEAAPLPGEGIDGFGTSAFAAGGTLYVSNVAGKVFGYNADKDEWKHVADLRERRIFHRMVATPDEQLLIVGGGEWMKGKATNVYTVPLSALVSGE